MFAVFAALLVAVDQITKFWAASSFPLGSVGSYIGLGFYFTYVQNTGAAFGIFQDVNLPLGPFNLNGTRLLGLLSAVVSLLIFSYLWRNRKSLAGLQQTALTLILAGALGNMIDRFRLSYVIDFIHFNTSFLNFPVFNVADSCVVIGAGLLIISSLVDGRKTAKVMNTEILNLSENPKDSFKTLTHEPQEPVSRG